MAEFDKKEKPPKSLTGLARIQNLSRQMQATRHIAIEHFKKGVTRSQNAVQGFGRLIEFCDDCTKTKDHEEIECLLNILIASHLLNLKPTISA